MTDGASGTNYYIDYIDPWDKQAHHVTYSEFCDGSYNGRKYDGTVYA